VPQRVQAGTSNGDVNRATMSDAVDQLAQALRDRINEAVQAAVGASAPRTNHSGPGECRPDTSRRRQRRGTAEAGAGPVNGGVREHSRLEEYARGG
jgi:hypothetical protein